MIEKTRFLPFILGGLFGLVIAILFAPRSGEETRQLLVENNREIKDNALESIQAVQEAVLPIIDDAQTRIETINQVPKERLAKLQDIGQTTLDERMESLDKSLSEAKETIALEAPTV